MDAARKLLAELSVADQRYVAAERRASVADAALADYERLERDLAERDAEIARLRDGVLVPDICPDAAIEAMIKYMPWSLSELQCRGLYKAAIDAAMKDAK
jgi:hypothetical protein